VVDFDVIPHGGSSSVSATFATGRPRRRPMHEIINGIFYVMRAGCPWRLAPSDLPSWRTIYRWFARFQDDGRF
jgi:transposase